MSRNTRILQGKDVVISHRSRGSKDLPEIGVKLFEPSESWYEDNKINSAITSRWNLLSEPKIERDTALLKADWLPELKKVRVKEKKGRELEFFGHNDGCADYLYPEEALYLMESNSLSLICGYAEMSVESAYCILLGELSDVTLREYRVFSYLARLGYRLVRHNKSESNAKSNPEAEQEPDQTEDVIDLDESSSDSVNVVLVTDEKEMSLPEIEVVSIGSSDSDIEFIECENEVSLCSEHELPCWPYESRHTFLSKVLPESEVLIDAHRYADLTGLSEEEIMEKLPNLKSGMTKVYRPDSRLLPSGVWPMLRFYNVNVSSSNRHVWRRGNHRGHRGWYGGNSTSFQRMADIQAVAFTMMNFAQTLLGGGGMAMNQLNIPSNMLQYTNTLATQFSNNVNVRMPSFFRSRGRRPYRSFRGQRSYGGMFSKVRRKMWTPPVTNSQRQANESLNETLIISDDEVSQNSTQYAETINSDNEVEVKKSKLEDNSGSTEVLGSSNSHGVCNENEMKVLTDLKTENCWLKNVYDIKMENELQRNGVQVKIENVKTEGLLEVKTDSEIKQSSQPESTDNKSFSNTYNIKKENEVEIKMELKESETSSNPTLENDGKENNESVNKVVESEGKEILSELVNTNEGSILKRSRGQMEGSSTGNNRDVDIENSKKFKTDTANENMETLNTESEFLKSALQDNSSKNDNKTTDADENESVNVSSVESEKRCNDGAQTVLEISDVDTCLDNQGGDAYSCEYKSEVSVALQQGNSSLMIAKEDDEATDAGKVKSASENEENETNCNYSAQTVLEISDGDSCLDNQGEDSYSSESKSEVNVVKGKKEFLGHERQDWSSFKGSKSVNYTSSVLEPSECTSFGEIFKKLQIFEEIDSFGSEESKERFEVMYDVYAPNVHFRKSALTTPTYRLIIMSIEDPFPTASQMSQLRRQYTNGEKFLFGVVLKDSVSFYQYNALSLPSDEDFMTYH